MVVDALTKMMSGARLAAFRPAAFRRVCFAATMATMIPAVCVVCASGTFGECSADTYTFDVVNTRDRAERRRRAPRLLIRVVFDNQPSAGSGLCGPPAP